MKLFKVVLNNGEKLEVKAYKMSLEVKEFRGRESKPAYVFKEKDGYSSEIIAVIQEDAVMAIYGEDLKSEY